MEEQLISRRLARRAHSPSALRRVPPALRPVRLGLTTIFLAIPIVTGLRELHGVAFRDNLDVFAQAMINPITFVLPVVAVLFCCLSFAHELDERFISNMRTRRDVRALLSSRLVSAGLTGFVIFFLFSAFPFLLAFVIWPALGDPGIDPSLYNETASSAARESLTRFSYSQLMSLGPWAFGGLYSAWTGLSGAVIALVGICSLSWLKNRFLALIAPFIVYFVESIVAALVGYPHAALVYSVFPFGLTQSSVAASAAPLLALALVALAASAMTIYRGDQLEHLT